MEYEEVDIYDIDIDYLLASIEILRKLKKEWEDLKKILPKDNKRVLKSVQSIDNLINYYFL